MYINDDKIVFPTRFGDATGKANERKMLDLVSGPNGIRKHYRTDSDGVTTRLKTHAGMPRFINDKQESAAEETALMPFMDSGSIDLTSILEPTATLRYADSQRAAVSAEELIGKIKPPSIETVGNPPVEGEDAKSCSGSRADKLTCMALCPASLFTGKTKLYVQALYGSGDSWQWEVDGVAETVPYLVHSNGTILDTNTGVYRSDDNTHWLIRCAGDGVLVTKLTAGKEVKKLVSLLSDTGISSLVKDRIEAYILAYSSPSPSMVFARTLSLPSPFMLGYGWKFNWSGTACDIIQHLEVSPEVGSGFDTMSTHYRVSITRNPAPAIPPPGDEVDREAARWSISVATVGGSMRWHNAKYSEVIAFPVWSTPAMLLHGSKYGYALEASNVTVYCFYTRDELNTINYSRSGGQSVLQHMRVCNPPSWMAAHDWTSDISGTLGGGGFGTSPWCNYGTIGTGGGWGEQRFRTSVAVSVGFSCDGFDTSSTADIYTYWRTAISGKSFGSGSGRSSLVSLNPPYEVAMDRWVYGAAGVVYTTSDGVSVYAGGNVLEGQDIYTYTPPPDPGSLGVASDFIFETTISGGVSVQGSHTETARSLLVIPHGDAQAVYGYGYKDSYSIHGGTTGPGVLDTGVWVDNIVVHENLGLGDGWYEIDEVRKFLGHSGSLLIDPETSEEVTDVEESNTEQIAAAVFYTGGSQEFSPQDGIGAFFSGDDIIAQMWSTGSSIEGIMFGYGGAEDRKGMYEFENPPPFIGWA